MDQFLIADAYASLANDRRAGEPKPFPNVIRTVYRIIAAYGMMQDLNRASVHRKPGLQFAAAFQGERKAGTRSATTQRRRPALGQTMERRCRVA
ncbi:hypothetical protein [Fulvimarina endophytica]|uniref:hypothetical protein n=1 Tax=Fulvimarina endophytica TaxID=2293836 RepID=UPI0011C03104|nr:hypothetical protein [Fulvimarina endophytica]